MGMTREERELSIEYLEGIKDNYIEGHGYERHPVPEYYAIENAIKALEQQNVLFESGLLKDCETCRAEQQPCEDAPSAQPKILACGEGELDVSDTNAGKMSEIPTGSESEDKGC